MSSTLKGYGALSSLDIVYIEGTESSNLDSSLVSIPHFTFPKQWEYSTVSADISFTFQVSPLQSKPYHSLYPLLFFTIVRYIDDKGLPRLSFRFDISMSSVNTSSPISSEYMFLAKASLDTWLSKSYFLS